IHNEKRWSYQCLGLIIHVKESGMDFKFTQEDGTDVEIKKGDLIGNVNFTPFGFEKIHRADMTAIISSGYVAFQDFFRKSGSEIDGVQLKFPTIFFGFTNKEMAK